MNKRKLLTLAMALCMVAILAIGGTLAYFTDTKEATNVITVGSVSAELYESKYHRGSPTGYLSITDQPNPTTDDDIVTDSETYHSEYLENATLMPFDATQQVQSMWEECTVAKNAYVKNTGDNDCFVRVRYKVPADIAEYLDVWYVGTQFIKATDAVATADARTLDNTDKTEPMIAEVNPTAANFMLQSGKLDTEGKFYTAEFIYAERLEPEEMTLYSPISKITMIPSVTEETIKALKLQDRTFDIEVEAEVIQADGFLNALEAFKAFDNK